MQLWKMILSVDFVRLKPKLRTLRVLSNARIYPRIAFHRMRMKTTKQQIRRRRRQKNLTTRSHARERGKEKDVTERRKRRKRVDGGREKPRGAWKRTKTRNEGRGKRLGGRTTATTDLWHSRSLFHGFAEGEKAGLSLARKARLIPLYLGSAVIYRSTRSRRTHFARSFRRRITRVYVSVQGDLFYREIGETS